MATSSTPTADLAKGEAGVGPGSRGLSSMGAGSGVRRRPWSGDGTFGSRVGSGTTVVGRPGDGVGACNMGLDSAGARDRAGVTEAGLEVALGKGGLGTSGARDDRRVAEPARVEEGPSYTTDEAASAGCARRAGDATTPHPQREPRTRESAGSPGAPPPSSPQRGRYQTTARGSGQQRWPQAEEAQRRRGSGAAQLPWWFRAQRCSYRVEEGPEKASGCGRSSHPPDRGLSGGNGDDHSGRHCHHGRSQSGHQQLQEEVGVNPFCAEFEASVQILSFKLHDLGCLADLNLDFLILQDDGAASHGQLEHKNKFACVSMKDLEKTLNKIN